MVATKAFDELIDLMLKGSNPSLIVNFKPGEATVRRVEELLSKEKTQGLSPEEKSELDHFLVLEHVIRLAKIRARKLLKAA